MLSRTKNSAHLNAGLSVKNSHQRRIKNNPQQTVAVVTVAKVTPISPHSLVC